MRHFQVSNKLWDFFLSSSYIFVFSWVLFRTLIHYFSTHRITWNQFLQHFYFSDSSIKSTCQIVDSVAWVMTTNFFTLSQYTSVLRGHIFSRWTKEYVEKVGILLHSAEPVRPPIDNFFPMIYNSFGDWLYIRSSVVTMCTTHLRKKGVGFW